MQIEHRLTGIEWPKYNFEHDLTDREYIGDHGILTCQHLTVRRIVHIGKESDNLGETEHLGVGDDAFQMYADGSVKGKVGDDLRDFILTLKPQFVRRFGISRQILFNWKTQINGGKAFEVYEKTEIRLKKAMQKMINHSRHI